MASRYLLLALQGLCFAQQQTVDCAADPENMYCCALEPSVPCLLEGFVRQTTPCSAACQKRYQHLGYECYKNYKEHFQWEIMQNMCDPTGIVEFKADTTSYRPNYGPYHNSGTVATSAAGPRWAPVALLGGFLALA
ncbi:unnamed protein product [Effrenium voratum]|nr:unnamed protein product [Effrenium voratum]